MENKIKNNIAVPFTDKIAGVLQIIIGLVFILLVLFPIISFIIKPELMQLFTGKTILKLVVWSLISAFFMNRGIKRFKYCTSPFNQPI